MKFCISFRNLFIILFKDTNIDELRKETSNEYSLFKDIPTAESISSPKSVTFF